MYIDGIEIAPLGLKEAKDRMEECKYQESSDRAGQLSNIYVMKAIRQAYEDGVKAAHAELGKPKIEEAYQDGYKNGCKDSDQTFEARALEWLRKVLRAKAVLDEVA
jgi:hypothetical protein